MNLVPPPDGTGANQLGTLLAPEPPRAGVDPCGSDTAVIPKPTDNGGVPVGGYCHRPTLVGGQDRIIAQQSAALLGPDTGYANIYPGSPNRTHTLAWSTYNGCVPICRKATD
jgi:hypothetical protein